MPTLYCQVSGGLANRLMSMISSIRIARIMDYKFTLLWSHDESITCNFNDVIRTTIPTISGRDVSISNIDIASIENYNGRSAFTPPSHNRDLLVKGWHHILLQQSDWLNFGDSGKIEAIENEFRNIASELLWSDFDYIKNLRKTERKFDLGIHLRLNTKSDTRNWEVHGNDFYLKTINYISKKYNPKSLFICTSNVELTKLIAEMLKSQIQNITYFSNSDSGTGVDSIESALEDMKQLSNCTRIFRNATSTFSALPALLGAEAQIIFDDLGNLYETIPRLGSGAAL